jgi:hypothetical protein
LWGGQDGADCAALAQLEQFDVNFLIFWQVAMNQTNWLSTPKRLFARNIGAPDIPQKV